jgi:hypothetical protein
MFFDHIGRYFARASDLQCCIQGTECGICGSTQQQLWKTVSGNAVCLAQMTITRKRQARKSPDEPIVPGDGPGKTAFSIGHFAIAGPHKALIVTNLVPNVLPPPSVELRWSGKGAIVLARRSAILAPPQPPFVAITFEQKANIPFNVSIDASRISLNGKGAAVIERDRITRLLNELIRLRDRLSGTTAYMTRRDREADQQRLIAIASSGRITVEALRKLPAAGSSTANVLRTLIEDDTTSNANETTNGGSP